MSEKEKAALSEEAAMSEKTALSGKTAMSEKEITAMSGKTAISEVPAKGSSIATKSPVKVAVASKDGISINLHFGHAREFWVYELSPQKCELLERREVDHYCHGQTGDQSAMEKILHTLADCDYAFTAKIGDGPVAKLRKIGVRSVDDYAYLGIEESLRLYAENRLYQKQQEGL